VNKTEQIRSKLDLFRAEHGRRYYLEHNGEYVFVFRSEYDIVFCKVFVSIEHSCITKIDYTPFDHVYSNSPDKDIMSSFFEIFSFEDLYQKFPYESGLWEVLLMNSAFMDSEKAQEMRMQYESERRMEALYCEDDEDDWKIPPSEAELIQNKYDIDEGGLNRHHMLLPDE